MLVSVGVLDWVEVVAAPPPHAVNPSPSRKSTVKKLNRRLIEDSLSSRDSPMNELLDRVAMRQECGGDAVRAITRGRWECAPTIAVLRSKEAVSRRQGGTSCDLASYPKTQFWLSKICTTKCAKSCIHMPSKYHASLGRTRLRDVNRAGPIGSRCNAGPTPRGLLCAPLIGSSAAGNRSGLSRKYRPVRIRIPVESERAKSCVRCLMPGCSLPASRNFQSRSKAPVCGLRFT